jgi:hypothetical protein
MVYEFDFYSVGRLHNVRSGGDQAILADEHPGTESSGSRRCNLTVSVTRLRPALECVNDDDRAGNTLERTADLVGMHRRALNGHAERERSDPSNPSSRTLGPPRVEECAARAVDAFVSSCIAIFAVSLRQVRGQALRPVPVVAREPGTQAVGVSDIALTDAISLRKSLNYSDRPVHAELQFRTGGN